MNRTALRLSTVAALLNGGAEPWPTMAGPHVYDSRQDDIAQVGRAELRPVAVVRTDEDGRSFMAGSAPTRAMAGRMVPLRIEIGVLSLYRGEADAPVAGWPASDSGLEAMLDLFEYQVEAALFGSQPWAHRWRGLWSTESLESTPLYTAPDEGNLRLAARELTLRVRLAGDCLPPPLRADEPAPEPALPAALVAILDHIDAAGAGDFKAAVAQIRAQLEARELPRSGISPPLRLFNVRWLEPEAATPEGEAPATEIEADWTVGDE